MSSRIHLIERLGFITKVADSSGELESGFWKLRQTNAATLLGGDIYFHKRRVEPSYLGGRIVGVRVQPTGKYAGRIVFRFRAEARCEGVTTSKQGWGMEKKIVR